MNMNVAFPAQQDLQAFIQLFSCHFFEGWEADVAVSHEYVLERGFFLPTFMLIVRFHEYILNYIARHLQIKYIFIYTCTKYTMRKSNSIPATPSTTATSASNSPTTPSSPPADTSTGTQQHSFSWHCLCPYDYCTVCRYSFDQKELFSVFI